MRKAVGSLVALRKESVDRNAKETPPLTEPTASLSARRAWIEMALLEVIPLSDPRSLSARRAWIEIVEFHLYTSSGVSLSARRAWIEMDWASVINAMTSSLSARRAWIEMFDLPG